MLIQPWITWIIRCCSLVGLLTLTACVTVQDFRNMTADERAVKVCDQRSDIKALQTDVLSLEQSMASSSQALRRGYHVFTDCEEYEVQTGTRTECKTLDYGVECEERILWETRSRCSDTPVPVDAALERSNLNVWQEELAATRAILDSEYQDCFDLVLELTPEEAYQRYRN